MYKKYKLHPVSALINLFKGLKEMLIPFAIVIIANGFTTPKGNIWDYLPIIIMAIGFFIFVISGIVKWWTFVYWFEDNELRVKYGLFIKKKRYIPFDRIQSLNYKEGIFHRIFGLVQVMVETAGSTDGKPEVVLTAVTKKQAKQIEEVTKRKDKLYSERDFSVLNGEEKDSLLLEQNRLISNSEMIYKITTKDLFLLATTSNSVGVVLAGMIAVLSQFSDLIPYEWLFKELALFMELGFVVVTLTVVVGLIIAWILSVMITFIHYYDFTIIKEEDRFIVTHGLLEKKRVTIPNNRVQAVKFVENPFRQLIQCVTVVVESASSGFGEKNQKVTLFPLISKKKMNEPLQKLFPQFNFQLQYPFVQSPAKAKPFFYRLKLIILIPVLIVCSFIFFPYGLLSILLIPLVILFGIWQYKTNGFFIQNHQLVLRSRMINRETFFVEKKRIQALQSNQSFFHKRKKVASIQASVMSGMFGATACVYHLEESDVNGILTWFEHSTASRKEVAEKE